MSNNTKPKTNKNGALRRHLAIDARIASYTDAGISRYFWGMLGGLAELDSEFDFTIFRSPKRSFGKKLPAQFTERVLYTPPHNRFERIPLSWEMRRAGPELVHAMDFFAPIGKALPQVLSVYDLYFLRSPETLDRASYRHYSQVIRYAEQAAHVVCCSEATKADLLSFSRCQPERVSVIYPGLGLREQAANVAKLPQENKYILFVGTLEPRKNLRRLIEAYRMNVAKKSSFPDLLLVGSRGKDSNLVLSDIKRFGLERRVRHLEGVNDCVLAELYDGAEFVVYPSLYEGFGFPILEAMSRGKPVLASGNSSMPEIGAESCIYIDPEEVESIAEGLKRLHEDPDLRAMLATNGKKRASLFAWEKAAVETLDVYRKALA